MNSARTAIQNFTLFDRSALPDTPERLDLPHNNILRYAGLDEASLFQTSKGARGYTLQFREARDAFVVRILSEGKTGTWQKQASLYSGDYLVELSDWII